MAKYIIDDSTLKGLADALRSVTGEDKKYTPIEMIDEVTHILEKGVYLLVDENGTEIPAVFVDNETVFTATANDIRIGMTAATEEGVTEGTKEIPAYITTEGCTAIPAGSSFDIPLSDNKCEYTKLQALICKFNNSMASSVETDKVSVNNNVYAVNSTDVMATVSVDTDKKTIKLGITNDSNVPYIIRYFTYKEEY